jgi:heavy metal translocating P-type ATPase
MGRPLVKRIEMRFRNIVRGFELARRSPELVIAAWTLTMIALHLVLRYAGSTSYADWPLWAALASGMPLVGRLVVKLWRREFGSDLLAGISIVVAILLGEYLAGSLVVLMLSGGEALEAFAVRNASSVLRALSKRMPGTAHRKRGVHIDEVPLHEVAVGDLVVVFPHEICPVDGTVVEGHGAMDESFLTGEPYRMSKAPGSAVLSGAVNGEIALVVRAETLARDSRYRQIVRVIHESESRRPRIRRLADQLGAWYTPLALLLAGAAYAGSGDPLRFLAVIVVATPCPLLIAIPVSIIGSISLAAKRSIIVRDPTALETADRCRTIIFDKTGTLTYGQPRLVDIVVFEGFDESEVLALVASLERYSKHPLSGALQDAASERRLGVFEVSQMSERPGEGLRGTVSGRTIEITGRGKLATTHPDFAGQLPPRTGGLECIALIDGRLAALFRFRDEPREEGPTFIHHLYPKHAINRTLLVSGDQEAEVRYLADRVGIADVYFHQSPEQKLEIVRRENKRSGTIFVGDGINDAPALQEATVGIAFGINNDITIESGDVVVLDSSLQRVDEFLHISRRMRRIALQSAVGGMLLSVAGMIVAALGYLPPVAGAIFQELIDVVAVLNALRVSLPVRTLSDFK